MIRHSAHKWHNSSLLTFLVISLCIFSQIFVYAITSTIQDIWMIPCRNVDPHEQTHCTQDGQL